jgi:NADH-quinone oxidoreductase subunit L
MVTGDWYWAAPFWLLLAAAAITAFYMFRLIFMTFHGKPRDHGSEHAHESPWTMTVPLIVLGTLAIFGGKFWLTDPMHAISGGDEPWFFQIVDDPTHAEFATIDLHDGHTEAAHDSHELAGHDDHDIAHTAHVRAMFMSIAAAGSGILLACLFYLWGILSAASIANRLGGFYRLVLDKYRFDELYNATVIRGTTVLSGFLCWVDENVIDAFVLNLAKLHRGGASLSGVFDKYVVDGMVTWVGETTVAAGQTLRRLQTGRIQQYVYFTLAGALALAAVSLLGIF